MVEGRSILEVQRYRRLCRYGLLYVGSVVVAYTYANVGMRANIPRVSTPYSGYAAGTELLFDAGKLYSKALDAIVSEEEWGVLEYTMMAKHFDRQGKAPYAYHAHYMAHLLSGGLVDGTKPSFAPAMAPPEAH